MLPRLPMTAAEFENTINTYRPENKNKLYGADTDWFEAVTRTPISHKHNLAIAGGSDKFSHRTVINIENNQGLLQKNDANNCVVVETKLYDTQEKYESDPSTMGPDDVTAFICEKIQ